MLGTNHLTDETLAQEITLPGQAHFAIPGDKRQCRDCWFWSPRRPSDLKAVCGKAASMMRVRPVKVPCYATACCYFTLTEPEKPE